MRFCKGTSIPLLITTIFYLISGCQSIKPVFLFQPSDFEPTFYAQVSDSVFTEAQLSKEFSKAKKTVTFSTKKVNSSAPNFSKILPLKNSGVKNFKTSSIGNKSIVIKSRLDIQNDELHQKTLFFNSSSKKQSKVPVPLLIAVGVLTVIIITLFVSLDKIFAKVTKNDFHIEAFLLITLFLLSIIAWIILVINLFLLLPAVYFGIFLGALILGLFIRRGINRYKKPKVN